MKNRTLLLVVLLSTALTLSAQDEESANAQANNPLANMTALNFHNYYVPRLTDATSDSYLNNTWVRFAKPFSDGRLLLRVSAPISTVSTQLGFEGASTTSGLGDINAFLSYQFVSKPTATIGAGPLLVAPTATDDLLGADQWQAGVAIVAFIAKNPTFQFGSLITYQTSISENDAGTSTSIAAFQPFYFWQLGKGNYLRGAPIWVFNLEANAYHVPFALGIGKVVRIGDTVCNLFVEPQYSMLSAGALQPQVQIFTGINLQFLN
ncbi:hypothetical protein HZ996_03930 [Cryomorphaceae bacterium]|nr:hypothetical protein HZ996_03930 [Cryomorphaceae bacterium]